MLIEIILFFVEPKLQFQPTHQVQHKVMNTEQNGIKENHSRHVSRNDMRQPRNEKPPRFQKDFQNSRQALESGGLPRNRGPERHSSLEHWTDEKNKSDRHYPKNDRSKDLGYPIATHQSDITFKKRDNNMPNRVGKGVCFTEFKENSAAQDVTDNNNQKRGKRENQTHNSENFCDRKARTISSEAFMVKSEQHFGVNNDYQNPSRTDNFSAVPNGDTEHHQKGRRVGPIKSSGPTVIPPFDDKMLYYNTGPKRRTGPIKPEKILEPSIHVEYGKSWRPGDECFALYWEDNKVCLCQMISISNCTSNVVSCTCGRYLAHYYRDIAFVHRCVVCFLPSSMLCFYIYDVCHLSLLHETF